MDTLFPMEEIGDAHLTGADLSEDGVYRYTLTRVWDVGLPLAMFVMLNPSTADAVENDPTIKRCIGFAKREGCGGIVVINLFALRSTDPKNLAAHADPVGPENAKYVLQALARNPAVVIAAWGAHPFATQQAYAMATGLAAQLDHQGMRLKCLGVPAKGHPRHPLYLKNTTPLTTYTPKG